MRIPIKVTTDLGYELSPKPKVVNWTPSRYESGNFLRSKLFQKSLELMGRSPWPVVETTIITMEQFLSDD